MRYINPVYKRELKQTARMKKTLVLLLAYNFLLACFGLLVFYLTFDQEGRLNSSVEYSAILTLYMVMTGFEFVMVLLIVPASTAGSVIGEREKQTLDILLSTSISPLQVVVGKLAASISIVILLAVSSLPVLAIVYSIGGVTLFDMVEFLLLITVTAIYIGSFGILFSVCCRRATIATICSYSAMIGLVFVLPAALFAVRFADLFRQFSSYSPAAFGKCFAGKQAILLLFNPFTSFVSMIRSQAGRGISMMNAIGSSGDLLYFLSQHWYAASLLCQLVTAAAVIGISAHRLNPMSKRIGRRRQL